MLTPEDIKDIVKLLDSTQFNSFRVVTESFTVDLERNNPDEPWSAESKSVGAPKNVSGKSSETSEAKKAKAADSEEIDSKFAVVKAPLLGTFYRAPKPGADPYVDLHSIVKSGDVVAIIETMKMMTPVYAGSAGKIIEIKAVNNDFVEANSVLMVIEPSN
jgi:acetyl-CoA carboxylase biotin carboxyl carrier protein